MVKWHVHINFRKHMTDMLVKETAVCWSTNC